jgi:fructuronate reductase
LTRLSAASLPGLPSAVARPRYDRSRVRPGIVHLGIGAFHRAHQAVYTDDALAKGDLAWGIVGASLRSPDTRDALAPQDGLYTVVTRAPNGTALRVVGSVLRLLVAPESPAAMIEAMAEPGVRIVSLTVTEKGYCHDPATRRLDERHPDILHDLAVPDGPRSAPGFIVAALALRRRRGIPPFTVLSCDNLPSNGETTRAVVVRMAELIDPALGRHVAEHVAFPSSMVDRIVPATTQADRGEVAEALGASDAWPVVTEPFSQWVIEDRFPQGRPAWETAGAQLVADVAPFETMKLRMLNGAHSSLAYLGYLAGHETVAATVADPVFRTFVQALWRDEIIPVVPGPPGVDLPGYAAALLKRFENPAIRHRTWQIAMDGSQKLPQRLLGTVRDRLARGLPIDRLALAVAAWIRYVGGVDEQGRPIDVRDPLAGPLRERIEASGDDPDRRVRAVLAVEAVFGTDLPQQSAFVEPVTQAYRALLQSGARQAAASAGQVIGGA